MRRPRSERRAPQSDPRSFIVRKTADEVFKVYVSPNVSARRKGAQKRAVFRTGKDALLETAMALHDAAMKDEYFIKRKLAPNVDFWCVLASLPSAATVAH